ncbi:hypothetical protein CJ030_MR4G026697 [Morella rubra]|uniref:Uncharacterized protein n=1 Tax=Morella rubra TaxID=262757 RepID=A0A6A1VTN4_9ROSI|nr:hypothetical protein CJ030_MR4G026697 [Morella rubra]
MGNNRQRKSSGFFSVFGAFKTRRPRGFDEPVEEALSARKVFPSDYDRSHGFIADPRVDSKAEAFIIKVRKNHVMASENHVMASESKTVPVYPPVEKREISNRA